MSVIKRLDTVISNKIAAGEVIEKIANVVKELVENSIDAKSTKIDIDLIESGLKSITVTDNGTGMDESDALLAFERHATSKIENVHDLFRISSLGFRGEALPSIAAISRVELTTNHSNSGIKVIYEDGLFVSKTSEPANQGTKINVTKLFYTTPARFKYLKSPQYELAVIQSMVNKFALAYPNVSLRLTNNQKLIFISRGNGSIIDILATIYSKDVAKEMLQFEAESRDYLIKGFTTNPIINRSNRNYILIFVNQRQIVDQRIIRALRDCYEQLIPKNRFPIAVLYIECDPGIIDVNIHPRKQEIKFSEYQKLLDLIKKTVQNKINIQPIIQKTKETDFVQEKIEFNKTVYEPIVIKETEPVTLFDREVETEQIHEEEIKEQTFEAPKRTIPDIEYIGQYTGTYLLFQNESGLYLLDQHAAAERIRYEKYIERMSQKPGTTGLLVPMKLNLSNEILIRLKDYLAALLDFGIEAKIENNALMLYQIPLWFVKNYELVYAEAIIMKLIEGNDLTSKDIIDDLAKLLACKHSLKANHYLTKAEADILVTDLRKCDRPYTCPHGRPIIVELTIDKIERLFNRVM